MVMPGCGGGTNNHDPVPTASVILTWDEPETNTAGYIVYYGTSSTNYTESINVGNNASVVISSLQTGETYYIAVTAYNVFGNESNYSDEIYITL
jgi:hypothetical protein